MRIEFTGRQTEIPERLRALAERKLHKLARRLRGMTHARVMLGADKHRQVAEVTLHSRNLDLAATEVGTELRTALLAAIEKLERQALRRAERRRELKRRPAAPVAAVAPPPGGDGRDVRVIRGRRSAVKPMTVEEAVLQMEGREDRPLVFRDADSEGVKVLYRRRDGNIGLIEPEV
jgi:putative sigma-54 modulation protein